MRSYLPSFEAVAPRTLPEALELLSAEPGVWRPLAGGTDVMVLLDSGTLAHKKWLSIWGLPELHGVKERGDRVRVGSLTTYRQLQDNPLIQRHFPILQQAAASVGAVAIQNRGTIGGNIANASPAADTPPALLAYGAELELVSHSGSRLVPYAGFHTGYKKTLLQPDELIAAVHLPKPAADARGWFRKVGTRNAQSISKVCLAGLARIASAANGPVIAEVRLALGSVGPTVLRCASTEAALQGKLVDLSTLRSAKEALLAEIHPIDDIRSTAAYRHRVALNLLEEFLLELRKSHVELGR